MTQEEKKEKNKAYLKGKEEELGGSILGYGQAQLLNRAIDNIVEFAGQGDEIGCKNSKEYTPTTESDPPEVQKDWKLNGIEAMKYKSNWIDMRRSLRCTIRTEQRYSLC